MPHGQPDFGAYAAKKTVGSMADNAELAARLGSIVTFDRRGDVVWLDDFEDNIDKWEVMTLGIGAAVVLSNEAARNGSRSAKLTTGPAIDNYAIIIKHLPYPALSKVGFEISFTIDEDLNHLFHSLMLLDGTNRYIGSIDYRPDVDELYYYDDAGAPQLIASGLNLAASIYHFHTMKLVVDIATMRYVRLILDERTYDLSNYLMQPILDATLPTMWAYFASFTGVAANQSIYVDDAIVTQNEP